MAGPLEDLVQRILRRVEAFKAEHSLDDAEVEHRARGRLRLKTLSAEPGFGFVSFTPHGEGGDPEHVIVPLGAVRELRIAAPEHEHALGFSTQPAAAG